jgi:hypothetical protein
MKKSAVIWMMCAASILCAAGACAATLNWQEGDFPEEDWDVVPWFPPLDSGGSDAGLVFTIAHGGNPGALRTMGVSLGGGPDDGAMIVQFHALWTWNPAVDGALTAIDGGLDLMSPQETPTRIGLAIQQGGNLFLHVLDSQAAQPDWTTHAAAGLTAADFPPLDPAASGQPDFSVDGSELRFGFATGQLAAFAGGETGFSHHVDNVNLTVTFNPVSSVGGSAAGALPASPQVHPNPFNPRTEITFILFAADRASLRVFDLAGRLVRTLEARRFAAGPHAVTWQGDHDDGRAAASGVYLVVLQTSAGRTSQRMTLAR